MQERTIYLFLPTSQTPKELDPSTISQILEYHLNKFSKVEFCELFNQHNKNTVMAETLPPFIP